MVFNEGALSENDKTPYCRNGGPCNTMPYCIRGHTAQAMRKGASKQEIMEAIWVADDMRAGGSYAHSALAIDEMELKEKSI